MYEFSSSSGLFIIERKENNKPSAHYFFKSLALPLIMILLLNISFSCKAQKKDEAYIRQPAVAGSFYPSNPEQLKEQLKKYLTEGEKERKKDINPNEIAAIIAPHAGYVFSGEVAASGFSYLNPDKKYTTIFLIGTSHQVYIKGASIFKKGEFKTPLGNIEIDSTITGKLIKECSYIEDLPGAQNKEHSLEVQLPFLQYRLKNKFKIVPIIIGAQSENICKKIALALEPYFTEDNLFVISSDFSHYPSYEDALKIDKATGESILLNSPEAFISALGKNDLLDVNGLSTSCCSWSAVLTLLHITKDKPEIKVNHIKYSNSGASVIGDKSRVVGYHSFIFTRKKETKMSESFSLSKDDKITLLKTARNTLENKLKYKAYYPEDEFKYSDALKSSCGAFVTLKIKGNLRGCIGRFITKEPLYKTVIEMAIAAATQDTRFNPVSYSELKEINIEISVLTPLKRIESDEEFEIGKHGIYIIKDGQGGTFLPQVAKETGWTKEEFLGHCARDKAGIGWFGWKDAELYTYEALVFGEEDVLSEE